MGNMYGAEKIFTGAMNEEKIKSSRSCKTLRELREPKLSSPKHQRSWR